MLQLSDGWVRIPPRISDESPEEIRRQRDLYRDCAMSWLRKNWKDVKLEDMKRGSEAEREIARIIEEFNARQSDCDKPVLVSC